MMLSENGYIFGWLIYNYAICLIGIIIVSIPIMILIEMA